MPSGNEPVKLQSCKLGFVIFEVYKHVICTLYVNIRLVISGEHIDWVYRYLELHHSELDGVSMDAAIPVIHIDRKSVV